MDDDADFVEDRWESMDAGMLFDHLHPTTHLAHVRPSSYATTLTLTARQLCASLLCFDPQKRATIYDAFGSPWVQSDLEEMSSVYCRRVNDD